MSDRLLTSKSDRARLYYEYDGRCAICGDELPEDWHADHIKPHSKGGQTSVHNMQPTCPQCNLQKSDKAMEFRRFQDDFNDLIERKSRGKLDSVQNILAYITPGGGKSLLPAILAKLVRSMNAKLCWIVPRVNLMEQGAEDFQKPWARRLVGHTGEMRETTNDENPTRGKLGYITTYQAVGQAPDLHEGEFKRHRYVLFCDEIHHVYQGSKWEAALKPLVQISDFNVFATGSIERGDDEPIAFLPYQMSHRDGGYKVDTNERRDWASIRYSRSEAISDGAILPLNFRILDGTAEWVDKNGRERKTETLAELNTEDARSALKTFLRTEAAHEILDSAVADWRETKKSYQPARFLVAAPDREHAKRYREYLEDTHGLNVGLAIVDDMGRNEKAQKEIKRFDPDEKKGPPRDALVTVAMAYEGMSIKPITHIACLTQYRTKSWLEQLFDRGNRVDEGKPQPIIFGPDDPFFEKIRVEIKKEQEGAVPPENMWEEEVNENEDDDEEIDGPQWYDTGIVPIESSVLRERGIWDGDEFGYKQIAHIKESMADLGMEEENPAKVAALLDDLGFDLSDLNGNGAGAPDIHFERGATPAQREEKIKTKIDNHLSKWAGSRPGDPGENKRQANTEVKRRFGKRAGLTEEELKKCWSYVWTNYPTR